MSLNLFDTVDQTFVTLILILSLNAIALKVFSKTYYKLILVFSTLIGFMLSGLGLPRELFNIQSVKIVGDITAIFFMMLIGMNTNLGWQIKNSVFILSLFGLVFIPVDSYLTSKILFASISYIMILFLINKKFLNLVLVKSYSNNIALILVLLTCVIFTIIGGIVNLPQYISAFIFGLFLPHNEKLIRITTWLQRMILFLLPMFLAQIGLLLRHGLLIDITWLIYIVVILSCCLGLLCKLISKNSPAISKFTLNTNHIFSYNSVFMTIIVYSAYSAGVLYLDTFIILILIIIAYDLFYMTFAKLIELNIRK